MRSDDITKWSECLQKREEDQSLSPGYPQGLEFWGDERNKQRILKKESQGSGEKLGQCGVWKPSEERVPKGRK